MPCDQRISSSIMFGANTDHDSMFSAFKLLDLSPTQNAVTIFFRGGTYDKQSNTLNLTGSRATDRTGEIKRAYMAEATKAQARKRGFTVVQGKSQYEFNLVKRSI